MAFTGRSGTGKSSLLRALTGVYPVSSGQCLYNGFDSQQLSEEQVRQRALFFGSGGFAVVVEGVAGCSP